MRKYLPVSGTVAFLTWHLKQSGDYKLQSRSKQIEKITHQLSAHGVARTQWQLVEDGALLVVELRHTAGVLGQTFGVDHSIEVS